MALPAVLAALLLTQIALPAPAADLPVPTPLRPVHTFSIVARDPATG
jgi:hypothetical protein